MGYFRVSRACAHFPDEWDEVVEQIKQWQLVDRADFKHGDDTLRLVRKPPAQGIEAKALYVFTVARRLIRSAWQLAKANNHRWNLIFIETSSLLFPMIELVGEARKADPAHQVLDAGIQWLRDPSYPAPSQTKKRLKANSDRLNCLEPWMEHHSQGPQVSDLFFLRNYYLHGLKEHSDPTITIADIINAELPYAITQQAETAMRAYWNQLLQDDGSHGWIERLVNADIHPFVIQGSELFEAGLVDPDIVDYLEDFNATVCK